MNPHNPQHRGGVRSAPCGLSPDGLPAEGERCISPPSQGFPSGTTILAIYRLLPGGGAGGAWEAVGRVPLGDERASKVVVAPLPTGRYRIAACGSNGRVRPGGQLAYERHDQGAPLRPVLARTSRDYRKGGVHTSTAARLSLLEEEAAELRRRLVLSRKRRGRLLAIIAQLDQDAERLAHDGQVSSTVADHLEEITGQRFHRPATKSFVRRAVLPEDIRAAVLHRERDSAHSPNGS